MTYTALALENHQNHSKLYHKNSPNSLSILTRIVTAFLPSYLPFKNSSVQCRRCTYPFFFLCTFGSFFILPVVNFFLFIEWLRYRGYDQIRWKSKRLILRKMGCFWVKEIHIQNKMYLPLTSQHDTEDSMYCCVIGSTWKHIFQSTKHRTTTM